MKLKGLAQVLKSLDKLDEILNEKIDNIEWDEGNNDQDQQKDEMFNAAMSSIEFARCELEEINTFQLEDF
jgi:hypothetical protein